jgi:hypothetical protein
MGTKTNIALATTAVVLSVGSCTVLDRLVGTGGQKVNQIATGDFWVQNYRDFKDLGASLSQVNAQVESVQAEIADYRKDFTNMPRADWPYDAREELARKEAVLRGYTSQYNMLAGRYNALVSDATKRWTKGSEPKEIAPFLRTYDKK